MASTQFYWEKRIEQHMAVIQTMARDPDFLIQMDRSAKIVVECYRRRGKLLVCGNGGSAADAQHIAGELVGRFYLERAPLSAEALSVNTSILTAIANDYEYSLVFERQVVSQGKEGDVLIGITTSGNSKNVLKAVEKAREIGMKTIGLAGGNQKSKLFELADCCISIPSCDTPRIQEGHSLVIHMLCEYVEQELFGPDSPKS